MGLADAEAGEDGDGSGGVEERRDKGGKGGTGLVDLARTGPEYERA